MNSNLRSKVFIVGIDGGTLELVKPWAEQGKLPTFARIMQNGVSGELMSTIQPISASSWSSFATGKNPGKHGILDFVRTTPFSYKVQFVNASVRDGKTLWRILSENGATVGVMNVPVTFPPEQVNGFLIAGMLSPSLGSEFTFPPGLLKEINANVGKYVIDVDVPNISGSDKRELFLNKAMESLKIRRDVVRYLYLKHKPDFFCVAFTESDRISHNFWKYMDEETPLPISDWEREKYGNAILNLYIELDNILAEVLSMIDDNTTLYIISDHGFGPVHKTVSVHRWLCHHGFIKMKKGGFGFGKLTDGFVRKFQEMLPPGAKSFVKKWMPSLANTAASQASYAGIDWSQTKAYPVGHFSDIFINVEGRQPSGIVKPGLEYEKLRDEVTEKLYEFKDPDDNFNVVERVYKREELYHGKYLENMPDLIIGWKDYKYLLMFNFPPADDKSMIWTIPPTLSLLWGRTGCHKPKGIFMAFGSHIKTGVQVKNANIMDIAPTVLYECGVPVPDDMDGRILTEIFDDQYVKANPLQVMKSEDTGVSEYTYSDEETGKVEKRLKDLGYLT
jgi:predicted AlkP superfamily phosphohydrolase/phosphomutase